MYDVLCAYTSVSVMMTLVVDNSFYFSIIAILYDKADKHALPTEIFLQALLIH